MIELLRSVRQRAADSSLRAIYGVVSRYGWNLFNARWRGWSDGLYWNCSSKSAIALSLIVVHRHRLGLFGRDLKYGTGIPGEQYIVTDPGTVLLCHGTTGRSMSLITGSG